MEARTKYSQNDEEAIITEFFGESKGRFLDIGAYNGLDFSNTHRLALLGWSGVLVEPSPSVMPDLLNLYKDNAKMVIINAAVCPDEVYAQHGGLCAFYDSCGDAISTTSQEHVQKWTQGWNSNFREMFIHPLPLKMLFDQMGTEFDFISIDVESTNWSLFQSVPWAAMTKTRMICIEHDGMHEPMKQHLSGHGFKEHAFNGENLILTR